MKKTTLGLIILWLVFLLFAAAYFFIEQQFFQLLSVWATGLAIFLLIKNKFPSVKYIIISVSFSLAVSLCYLAISFNLGTFIFQFLATGLPTFLCSLAVFSVMEKCGGFFLIHKNEDGRSGLALSLLIAILTGAVLSFINFLLMKSDGQIDFAITLQRLAIVLSPAIYEELVCRAIFMAFCIYIFGPAPTKFQIFTMWFMMTFPHTLAHHQNLMATVILCILFGLPFALLQKKRDIFSAMVSHGLVDAVRFALFGIGM